MDWTREIARGMPGGKAGVLLFQELVRRDHGALLGNGRSDAAAGRTGSEIGVGFGGIDLGNAAGDADLAAERGPVEDQGGSRIGGEFAALAAQVVGEEDEAVLVHAFEQDHAGGDLAVRRGGGEGHGVGLREAGANGGAEPLLELADGVRIEAGRIEAGFGCQVPV